MNIGVVGSRTFNDYPSMVLALDSFIKDQGLSFKDVVIVSGGARGADSWAKVYAISNKCGYKEFLPEYNVYGTKAPFVRNRTIVENSDVLIAFWDNESKGTKNSIDIALQQGIEVIIHSFKEKLF